MTAYTDIYKALQGNFPKPMYGSHDTASSGNISEFLMSEEKYLFTLT